MLKLVLDHQVEAIRSVAVGEPFCKARMSVVDAAQVAGVYRSWKLEHRLDSWLHHW